MRCETNKFFYAFYRMSLNLAQLRMIVCAIVFFPQVVHADPLLQLKNTQEAYPLGRYISVLEDPSGKLTIDDITRPEFRGKYRTLNKPEPSLGYIRSAFWIRLQLKNESGQNRWLLDQRFANAHYLDLYVEGNPAAEHIFGFTRDEAMGRTATELIIPPGFLPHVNGIWQALLANKGGARSTNDNITREGQTITCEWYNTPLVTEAGEVIGVASLVADVTEKVQALQELELHRDHLEELVRERTTKLEDVNKELESFSYSVSHDLRAPLRAIDGFSLAIIEDYADKLDTEGRNILQRVRRGAVHMSGLIDDMLQLSRVTRHEIRRDVVNLSILAATVLGRLQESEPDRKVEQIIAPGIEAEGDNHLLQVVLDNLVGNAWKYTGKTADPGIEFGVTQQDDESVYFVKDNGAGFDMRYADKLFGAFRRFHKEDDFPGTGIGLATVQRIIHRHSGRIWAEEGKGATFYFTLPSA